MYYKRKGRNSLNFKTKGQQCKYIYSRKAKACSTRFSLLDNFFSDKIVAQNLLIPLASYHTTPFYRVCTHCIHLLQLRPLSYKLISQVCKLFFILWATKEIMNIEVFVFSVLCYMYDLFCFFIFCSSFLSMFDSTVKRVTHLHALSSSYSVCTD